MSFSLGVWWCVVSLAPVGAQALLRAVETPVGGGLGFVINGSNNYDRSGTSVSGAGDVNGDGLDDVIVGASSASPDGRYAAGRSYVVFGKRGGQPAELSTLENGTSRDGFVINGSNNYDGSGYSVDGAGDVNGDGLDDVIVGAPGADPDSRYAAGRSYVVFGKRGGQPVELATLESGTSRNGFVINGSNDYDSAGIAVSGVGDVNGDGLDDVIVGAPGADPDSRYAAGRSYVVFGKRGGQPVELATLESGTSRNGFVINGSIENFLSGVAVSGAGDVNGDGLDDLIVGTDPDGRYNTEHSYVVFGKRNGRPVELSALESGNSRTGFVINGIYFAESGESVGGAGDVNGDGLDDVIVGAPVATPPDGYFSGQSYVVFGKRNSQPVELTDIGRGTGRDGFVINGSNDYDSAGRSVGGAGDVNGDGLDDVLVYAPFAYPYGRSYVVFGKRSTQPVELSTLESGTGRDGFVINGSNNSFSGAEDVNGDGLDDVIVGVSSASPDGRYAAGRSYVVFGKRNSQPVELADLEAAGQLP
ncbi:FG-GAP-like repeat-containing protein [Gloeobacter violaceus]|uniref:FG-GAP-like repeat-containing protein n=1 Tax=Gloeobacter violaceus TaxID=33072 RepID=UPI0013E8CD32|nr:FG-GAP-like repeat-containing protein [Gloeobacter violaceus]